MELPIPVETDESELSYTEPVFHDLQKAYAAVKSAKRKPLKREKIAQAYDDAFELIGGVPRLALFAHEDPKEFYKLHARLIPAESKQQFDGEIRIVGFVQPTALDDPTIVSEQ
jgi:hypothetical protein